MTTPSDGMDRSTPSGTRSRATIRAMMNGAIDYAGLFPPAALSMTETVHRYAAYAASPESWMLGRLIVPVARLEEFVDAYLPLAKEAGDDAPDGPPSAPWRLSVIAKASDAATLAAFNARYGALTRIDTVEAPTVNAADIPALGDLAASYAVFAEVDAAEDPAPIVALLAQHRVRAKVRTGGVTPTAIPTPAQVARFLVACRDARVPFKATAGLHHAIRAEYPLTYEPASARATMFGFVNVLLASAAAEGGASASEVERILAATDGFVIDGTGALLPTGRLMQAVDVAKARITGIASFGSCSFDEPVQELTQRGLL
jgi:hypothetical protein